MSRRDKPLRTAFAAISLTLTATAQNVNPDAPNQFNWNQTTGLVNIPIARALRRGAMYGAFDFKSRNFKTLFGSEFLADPDDKGNGSFHFLFSPIKNVELAVMALHDANRGGNVNTLNRLLTFPPGRDFSTALKWVVNEESANFPAIAVGVENLTYPRPGASLGKEDDVPDARVKQRGFYAVASKAFELGEQMLNVNLGVGTGRFRNRPFGGIEYGFQNGLALLAEYDGFQGTYGVRYTGVQNLRMTAAMQGGQPTFQIGYTFNPFDLFNEGTQHDYSPFVMPKPKPEPDPWAPEAPKEPSTETIPSQASPPVQVPPARAALAVANHAYTDNVLLPQPAVPDPLESTAEPEFATQARPRIPQPSSSSAKTVVANALVPKAFVPKLPVSKHAGIVVVPGLTPVRRAEPKVVQVATLSPKKDWRSMRPSKVRNVRTRNTDEDAVEFGKAEDLGQYHRRPPADDDDDE